MKRVLFLLLIAVALLCAACQPKPKGMTIITENYPPLSFESGGKITGFGADVIEAIQNELKTDYQPILLSWDAAYKRALKEPNVVLFTMERTPEREGRFHFIGPLGANTTYFYALRENNGDLPDLEAARQAIGIATTTNWFSEQMLQEKGFTNLLSNPDPLDAIRLMTEGKAELGIFTDLTFPQICAEAEVSPAAFKPVLELTQSEYYIAISKSTDEVKVEEWRSAFERLKNEGVIEDLKSRWIK
ncbi:MAG: ABC transporter substrate-binding protein [Candidatus Cloacimonetes bacterium]|nr:ABC transporter substrate-binding protein [Candidatus Cloacimonadota bacterium]